MASACVVLPGDEIPAEDIVGNTKFGPGVVEKTKLERKIQFCKSGCFRTTGNCTWLSYHCKRVMLTSPILLLLLLYTYSLGTRPVFSPELICIYIYITIVT